MKPLQTPPCGTSIAVPAHHEIVLRRESGEVPRVIAKGPDHTECQVDLEAPRALLLGRAPSVDTALSGDAKDRTVDLVTLAAPSISANHALVWIENGAVCVQDLGSKNGTWVRVPHDRTLRVDETDVTLRLAQGGEEVAAADEPGIATWRARQDFATSIVRALEQWFRQSGIDVHVDVVPSVGAEAPPTRIPLSTGEGIEVTPVGTAHASWSRQLERVWRWVARQNALFDAEEEARGEGLILASRPIRDAHREVVDAARANARTMLITGPSGAGKEVLAETFHRNAGVSGPFIAVNCSMFSKELLRTELFGASAGAFTDGKQRILGAVERAQGGTLFLDEVGDMPLEVQPMLLRFLDRREFQSLGQYGRTQRADVRVVAATNRDLREAVRNNAFRADLWYRLSVHVIDIPSLRNRFEDLVAYLESIPLDRERGSLRDALSSEAMEVLRAHSWEGNFRELTNFAERLPRHMTPGAIDATTCQRALERGSLRTASLVPPVSESDSPSWSELASRAMAAFVEDRGHEPRTWDHQKEWNEKYLKPLLFFHMSSAAQLPPPFDENGVTSVASQVASRMQADRGTAAKQLARYFERYGSSET